MKRFAYTGLAALALVAGGCEESGPSAPTTSPPRMEEPGEPRPHNPGVGPVAHDGQFLRRLTRPELVRSLGQVLGPVALPPTEPDLHQAGFARVGARHTTLSNSGVERISTAIEEVLDQVFADDALRDRVIGCDPAQAGCAEDMIRRVGQAAWRRPVAQDELIRYLELYSACDSAPYQGARCALSGLLQSPYFQYRVELPSDDNVFRGYAMASRLSFLLWSLPPDLPLLQAAHRGELDTAEGVRAKATEMLADPRAREGLRAFVDEWFRTDRLERLERDVLAQTNEELQFELGRSGTLQPWLAWVAFAAEEELRAMVEHHVFDEDADYLDLLTTDVTFVDSNLVDIYGGGAGRIAMEGQPNALGFAKARHAPDSPRRGLLGTMALLGQLGKQNETSPTRRGLYVMRKVLCQEVGEPPDNIDMCQRPEGVSRRNSMENHHMCAASCSGCHAQMDPIGFALDNFSTIGVYRNEDDWGFPIDSQVSWRAGNGDEMQFNSLRTMADQFKARPEATECVTRQVFRFATGREEGLEDKAQIEALTAAFRGDGRKLKSFLIHFVGTDAFRTAPAEAEGEQGTTLAMVFAEIFDPHCGTCHVATNLGGFSLVEEGLGERLRSASSAGMPLVTPGNVEQSYLWHKVVGTHTEHGGSGEQMPPSTPLSETERNLLKTWIEEGAR